MFLRSEKVTVIGFFGAPRCAVVIHPGSWWSGVAHVMFDGDQVVTAVPRKCLAKFDGEDWEKFQKYNTADTDAVKGFQSGGYAGGVPGLKEGEIPAILNRDEWATPTRVFNEEHKPEPHIYPRRTFTPEPSFTIDEIAKDFTHKPYIVDEMRGRVLKWRGLRKVGTTSIYGSFEFGDKQYQIPAAVIVEAYARHELRAFKHLKAAKRWLIERSEMVYQDLFKPGQFFSFDGSPRLWQVEQTTSSSEDGIEFLLFLCCDDENAKPAKVMTLENLAQSYRSGHIIRYYDFEDAVRQLSDKSTLNYYQPGDDE